MKVKVIRRLLDKYTGERYLPGDLFDGTPERIDELVKRGRVEPIEKKVSKNGTTGRRKKNTKNNIDSI